MKASDFVKAVLAEVGHGYWYGTFVGHVSSEALLATKAAQFSGQYTADYIRRSRRWLDGAAFGSTPNGGPGTPVCDCVGLIKGIVWRSDFGGKYQAASDLSANGIYNACVVKGGIDTLPEKPGVLVWKDGHVGVYVGNGAAVEARGADYGVVITQIKDRTWTGWGECHLIDYSVPQLSDMEKRALAAEAQVTKLTDELHAAQAMVSAQASQLATIRSDNTALKAQLDELRRAGKVLADFAAGQS
jgi:hypothetical protein